MDHLTAVATRAADFASAFGWAEAARAAGLLHDIGKASDAVQAYLHGMGPSRNHSTAGARVAQATYPKIFGRMIAAVVAGHHSGLLDGERLDRQLDFTYDIPAFAGGETQAGLLPPLSALRPTRQPVAPSGPGFGWAFRTRMLFSCLVDADFLETECFYADGAVARGG